MRLQIETRPCWRSVLAIVPTAAFTWSSWPVPVGLRPQMALSVILLDFNHDLAERMAPFAHVWQVAVPICCSELPGSVPWTAAATAARRGLPSNPWLAAERSMKVAEAGQKVRSGRWRSDVGRLGCCTLLLPFRRSVLPWQLDKSVWLIHGRFPGLAGDHSRGGIAVGALGLSCLS